MRSPLVAIGLLSLLVVTAAPRKLLDAETTDSVERQRILAELEEVHNLRERMLQQCETPILCIPLQHCSHLQRQLLLKTAALLSAES